MKSSLRRLKRAEALCSVGTQKGKGSGRSGCEGREAARSSRLRRAASGRGAGRGQRAESSSGAWPLVLARALLQSRSSRAPRSALVARRALRSLRGARGGAAAAGQAAWLLAS